jgi:hypothetical protein
MKVDLQSIDLTQFYVNEHVLNGEAVYLVIPKQIGVKWTKETKVFRSSVWDSNGNLISAGFPKFTNWGEAPDVFPLPTSLKNCVVVEKLDGSTLIISKYKGQYIIRTRGTIDAFKMEKNGFEIEIFKNEILPKLVNYFGEIDTWTNSVIFEWTSPLNQIVINYGDKPRFVLIGMIDHSNYMMQTQSFLDEFSKEFDLQRPPTYTFTDITDLISNVEQWKGKEGVCIYSKNGQEIHKCKGAEYLIKHRFKSEATLENTLEIFFNYNQPSYQQFEEKLIQQFDYECFGMVRGYASSICDASKQVGQIVKGIEDFIKPLKPLPRKDAANLILSSYGSTGRSNMAFTILDGKLLSTDQTKKLYWQVLKK